MEIFNDVWANEPKISSNDINSFMNHSNAFGTPHIAGYTFSSKERQIDLILKKFNDLFSKSVEREEVKKFIKLSSLLSNKLVKSKNLDFKSMISEVFSTRKTATEFKALLSEYDEMGKTFGPEEFEKFVNENIYNLTIYELDGESNKINSRIEAESANISENNWNRSRAK